MPTLHLVLLAFLLGCATGALFMGLLRRRAIAQVRREFEQELQRQLGARKASVCKSGWSPHRYDA